MKRRLSVAISLVG